MAVVDAAALLQHVLCLLCLGGVGGAVGVDVGADVGEEVLTVARLGDRGAEAFELALVVLEHVAVTREVVLLEGGGGQGGFRVEEAA